MRKLRKYTLKEKLEIPDRINSGEIVNKVSRESKVPYSTILTWKNKHEPLQESVMKNLGRS